MELSVIIVSYNRKEMLEQCLSALRGELEGVSSEVVVVDNASGEDIQGMLREKFPEIILIGNRENVGFARANNQGMEIARGKYFLVLNPDTVVQRGSIAGLVRYLEGHPGAGAVGPKLLFPDGSFQPSTFGYPTIVKEWANLSGLDRFFPTQGDLGHVIGKTLGKAFPGFFSMYLRNPVPRPVPSVFGACMLVRREVWEKVGGFDPDYFLYWEEADWCYRMVKQGYEVHYEPGSEVVHRGGENYYLPQKQGFFWYYQSLLLFFSKHYSPARTVGLKAMVISVLLAKMFLHRLRQSFNHENEEAEKRFLNYQRVVRWYRNFTDSGETTRKEDRY